MIFNIDYRKGEQRNNIHKQRIINKLRDSSAGSLQMRQHLETEESSRVHNHEVRSSILRPATRKHSRPLCFFVYRQQASPKGLDIDIYGAESLLSKRQKWRWTARERSDWSLMSLTLKHHRVPLKCFLGYHANGHKGLEGAHRATETSCVPLLENQALTKFS